jgi:PKHD-type hydroxylase
MPLIFDVLDAFGAGECDRLIALADAAVMQPGRVQEAEGYLPNPAVRRVDTSFHPRAEATRWIYDRLDALFAEAGQALGLAVGPMTEPVQLMRYGVGCHFRTFHSDAGPDRHGERLVSVSVELSERSDYDGGDLEIVPDTVGRPRTMKRGGARFFPSRALHRVTPVTRGVRYALVNWTGGPAGG